MAQLSKKQIFVYGASGHAKVVIDIIEQGGQYEVAFLVDDDFNLKGKNFFGYPVIGGKKELLALESPPVSVVVAIGNNQIRSSVSNWLEQHKFELATVVHPKATLARNVSIGAGTVIMPGAVINSDTQIGRNAIVNTRASIDHDCLIADGVHLAPGSTLCGSVSVGERAFVCAGATVAPNQVIGAKAIVGAGAVVLGDVANGMTVIGVPATEMTQKGE